MVLIPIMFPLPVQGPVQESITVVRGAKQGSIALLLDVVLDSNHARQGMGSDVAVAHGLHDHHVHLVRCGVHHILLYRLRMRLRDPVGIL